MCRSNRVRDYLGSSVIAFVIAGMISLGMTFLTDSGRPEVQDVARGAVRLAQPEPDRERESVEKPPEEKPEPPKNLPKQFSVRRQSAASRPALNLKLPAFSAEINPLMAGGMALPDMSALGGGGFSIDEVDVKPQVLSSVAPEYPYGARRNRVEGKVVVRLLVNREGRAEQLSVHSSTPQGVFDKAALDSARRWMFKPGRYDGNAVDTWVLIPFNFELTQ